MKTLTAICAVVLCFASTVYGADKPVIDLWPDGLPAGAVPMSAAQIEKAKSKMTAERTTYVEMPSITVYRAPADKANGCGVVVCPGGGYNILAWPKEGLELAEWFNSFGVTAVVLKYRVPRRSSVIHKEPLQDAQRAIRMLRHHADEWNVDRKRIGVLGFSAGGHLTVMTATQWDKPAYAASDAIDKQECRPNFVCPIYAAYLGNDYKDNVAEIGSLIRINKQTPPMFLAVTWDDSMRGAQSALLFAKLREAGVSAEVHVYARGGHGYGIRPSNKPVSKWHHHCEAWLRDSGFLNSPN